MVAPAGSRTQRRFAAPSLHNGYCGLNGRFLASIVPLAMSEYRPVSDSSRGSDAEVDATGPVAPSRCPVAAPAHSSAAAAVSAQPRSALTAAILRADRPAAARGSSREPGNEGRPTGP